jgi:hypothetical protein
MNLDSILWGLGAFVVLCLCVIIVCSLITLITWVVKKTFDYWWDQTLVIYRFESVRHYFKIMVANGRTGLLKEVEKSKQEAKTGSVDENI